MRLCVADDRTPAEIQTSAIARCLSRFWELTTQICVESTQLPGDFHRDPAERILAATARIYNRPLVVIDRTPTIQPATKERMNSCTI